MDEQICGGHAVRNLHHRQPRFSFGKVGPAAGCFCLIARRSMHDRFFKRLSLVLALACVAPLVLAHRSLAYEPIGPMVEALCERGYFDTAIEYLEVMKSAHYVPDSAKDALLYQQGVVLMRQAAATNDNGVKARLYDDAAARFKQFLTTSPSPELAAAASGRMATMEVEKARNALAQALRGSKQERDSRLAEVRKAFEAARAQLIQSEGASTAAIEKMPKLFAPGEEHLKQRKIELASDLAEARMTEATIDYDLARTYTAGSDEAKRHLSTAAEKFGRVAEDYRTRPTGLFARLWEGKCYQESGEHKRALTAFEELSDLTGNSKLIATIRAKAIRQAIECLSDPQTRKYEAAATRGQEWISANERLAANDPDGLAIRYVTAVALQKLAATLAPKSADRVQHHKTALRLARQVARYPGEFQNAAEKLVKLLGGTNKDDPEAEPTTFAMARDRGLKAMEKIQNAKMGREISEQTGETDQVKLYDQQEKEAQDEAAHYFKLALQLKPGDAKIEDINAIRHIVCYFYYTEGKFLEAAVLGEYLAFNFPKTAEGRQGARIALASWVKVYSASRESDKSFEIGRITRLADFIVKTWPDQQEAVEASSTLLSFAIQQHDVPKVLEYLERIPADSPKRGEAEIRAGQSLWTNYLLSARLPEDERPPQADLDNLKTKAAEILTRGIEHLRSNDKVTPTLVAAVLSLAQILVDTGQPDKAIEWLENETIGPLKLLNDGNEVVFSSVQMPIEIYKLALRAYVAVQPQRLEDAERVMNALEKAVGSSGDEKANETLTVIYIKLGRELQQQLEELRNSKKSKELKAVSEGFETFLKRIATRNQGNTWSSLNWVAETFYSLGTGYDDGGTGGLSADATRYYTEAVNAYQRILERAASDPKFAPNPDALVGVQLRMAVCLRKIGKFDEAISTIVSVLKDRPMMLPAQVMGAETYQAKGAIDKDAYAYAILGGPEKDTNNQSVIWGWAKLSKLTMNNDKFADTFHQARLRLAECRYRYGMLNKNKAKRRKTINAAREDLWITYKLYPDLGGQEQAEEYNRMLKQIQRGLGEKAIGLEEFRRRSAEIHKATKKLDLAS